MPTGIRLVRRSCSKRSLMSLKLSGMAGPPVAEESEADDTGCAGVALG